MRQLTFVRVTDDGTSVVVATTDGNEEFALANNAALRDATHGHAVPPAAGTPGTPVALSTAALPIGPREIQMRVRAGESPEQVADSCGVELARILRFATPVVEERLRIAGEARRARARRSTTEGQVVVFGEAVDERFLAHGLDAGDVTWSSRRREDGEWIVRAEWTRAEATYDAEWVFHRASRLVTPLDDTAADLLSDRPIRPVTPPAAEPTPRISLAAAPALAPGVVAFPPMPEALTDELPVPDDVFDQEAAPESDAAGLSAVVPSVDEVELEFEAPPLPLGITDPTTRPLARLAAVRSGGGKREESDDERAARAKVPSWDEILLGVRRKQD